MTYETWLADNLSGFDVLGISESTTHAYATVRLELGRPIPANDAWIAALALEHWLPILSRDAHFDAVARLQRRGW